jgi:2,3-bisphosphoglycerate-dependent phosphoglycerate mutase
VSAEQLSTRIVLVRHGESRCNALGIVGGQRGCTGLTPQGADEVGVLAERLVATGELAGTAALYSSTLARAIETAEILRPALERDRPGALPIIVEPALREIDPGQADGLTWGQLVEQYGPFEVGMVDRPWAPGGESWVGFVARAAAAVERLADAHPGQLVVVACHGGIVEATMLRFLPLASGVQRLSLKTKNASMTEWERTRGHWTLLRYNDGGESHPPPTP